MTGKILLPIFLLPLLTASLLAQETSVDHPLKNDPTGIQWVFSLDEAVQKARETNRIVMLKPVSFRSVEGSDQLSPSSETQRSTSFVDSRVVALLNRRFVPYYFDMDEFGFLYDEKASDLARELYPDMRYLSSMPTPPLLFMTPEKKMLGHASNFLSSQELLDRLVEILDENPAYRRLTTVESVVDDPVEKAWIHYELRDLEKSLESLKRTQSSDAYYLRVRIAREQEDWRAMKQAIKMVTDTNHIHYVDVENVLRYWKIRNLEGIKAKCQRIKIDNPRYQEAMYYLGLAQYHTGQKDSSITTWEKAIQHEKTSAWAYRLDLALGLVKLNPDVYLSAQDSIPSVLGRKYLCPNGIDDLAK